MIHQRQPVRQQCHQRHREIKSVPARDVKAIIRKFEMEIKELREERDDLQKRVAVFESRAEQDYYMRHVEREMQPNGLAYITRKKDAS
jgi:hypothetical protein